MLLSRKKSGLEDEENLERWLLPYADLITLLLAFFIVMYSISRVDSSKFVRISEAFTSTLKVVLIWILSLSDNSRQNSLSTNVSNMATWWNLENR